MFLRHLAINRPFNIPPHPMSVPALPGENRTNKILPFYLMRYDYLINITHKNIFCIYFWCFGWYYIQLFIFELSAVKLFEMSAHYANTSMESEW